MKPKTRLKWKRLSHGEGYCDHIATLRIDKGRSFLLVIELEQRAPNRVEVGRFIWLNNRDDVPLFEHVKTHTGTIADFAREFRGLEWNLLTELHSYLDHAARKVNDLMHERETTRP